MSQFTFNLNGVGVDQVDFSKLAGSTAKIEGSLYSQTKDSDLTYSGSDTIVWDRINAERLRRGLPGLAEIGYPRPPDDTPAPTPISNSPASNSETFTVKGPPGMTFEQAKAIFDQQAKSGGLVGFKVGDALSAATQAADGFAAAQGQLAQAAAGLAGKLPTGTDLNSLTASLGPAAAAASGQLSSALSGSIPSISSTITGASAGLVAQLPAVTGALTGQAAQIGSLANQAITGISKAIGGIPTNGINVADFAKQGPALGDISNLSKSDVTGVLAQASKLVGQASDQISSALGAGKFGFDAGQLEKAGLVKPGTAAAFLAGGESDLVSVLKSPTVWTGKDGVKSLDGLLNNSGLQDKVQQGLMSSGLKDLKSLGVPTAALKPQALAGLAINAAKSVPDTLKWATGSGAVPGLPNLPSVPALPPDVAAKFDAAATNGAFAVNLTQGKIEPPVKQEEIVEPASNTVNTDTLDAAAARVVGNDKVPTVTASSASAAETAILAYVDLMNTANASLDALAIRLAPLTKQSQISQSDWTVVNDEYILIKATFNSRNVALGSAADNAIRSLPQSDPSYSRLVNMYNGLSKVFALLKTQSETNKKIIANLANKIAT